MEVVEIAGHRVLRCAFFRHQMTAEFFDPTLQGRLL